MIDVIIPAFNEENAIGKVIQDIPNVVREIVVVDNNSTDSTFETARVAGATVLKEARKGYGYACLKGIEHLIQKPQRPDIIVFLDGDYSDYPEELPLLTEPIIKEKFDMVIGARNAAYRTKGAMTPQQVFGNWLACTLMRMFYNAHYTDLGPFRAIRTDRLLDMKMEDKTYGWTVEMQLKALKHRLKYTEVPVRYRARIGESKVSGTVKGTIMAGYKILGWIFKYSIQ
ncbi:glycosyltransferase family 2 protein [Robertkochia solimangrovi]|nr:glycosyltransferase family 2 protein [Robertkochia solimangrovi]